MENNNQIKVRVDTTEIDAYIRKAKELIKLLQEAKTLADELAPCKIGIELKIDV